jgi:nitrile hydratase subunit beta
MPRFRTDDRVQILDIGKPGHIRVPWFARLKHGVVERYCGAYLNPEDLAYGRRDTPPVDLYRVRLRQVDLWEAYDGSPADTVDIEVYDHWLTAGDPSGDAPEAESPE